MKIFDDGTMTNTDSSGAVTSSADNNGDSLPVASPDGGLTQQFADLVTNGVNALIDNRLPPAPVPQPGVVPAPGAVKTNPGVAVSTSLLASPAVKMAGLALLGLWLFKRFA